MITVQIETFVVPLILLIIVVQHLYNWLFRNLWKNDKEGGLPILMLVSLTHLVFIGWTIKLITEIIAHGKIQ